MVRKLKNIYHFFNAIAAGIYYGFPANRLNVIGITGTDGKTTTSTMLCHILKTAGKKTALVTTVAAYVGDEEIDTGFHTTTPNPWVLQKLITRIVKSGAQFLVLETTSHALDQHRIVGVKVNVGVMTHISHEHLAYHKTMNNYIATKAKLFKKSKHAILNREDKHFKELKAHINKMIITYDKDQIPKYVKNNIKEDYNQLNATAAVMAARVFDVDENEIGKAITSFEGVKGRVEEVKNEKGIKIIVDFAHTPNAIDKVLTALRKQTRGKLIVVFGATGRRDVTKRPIMGRIASQLADQVIITSDDCYDEKIGVIINQIKSGIEKNHGNVVSIVDRQFAINYAVGIAKKGDTIALLGQGHEQSMNLDGITETPWSDVKAIKKSLKKHG